MRTIDPIAKEDRAAAALTPARPIVLLTGFGPFPGVPENATAVLVPRLAKAARELFPTYDFVAEILPTEWTAAPQKAGIFSRVPARFWRFTSACQNKPKDSRSNSSAATRAGPRLTQRATCPQQNAWSMTAQPS